MHHQPASRRSPLFLAVEGPNGVGKTTIATLLARGLAEVTGVPAHLTSEPSDTPLGRLLRCEEWTLTGRSLALAIAGDRYAHIDDEIIPTLNARPHVVTDRYVQSSLVLQRLDGMAMEEIWRYNRYVLPASMSIYLEDDPEVLAARLAARGGLSRLELTGGPVRELALYNEARRFLDRQQWRQVTIDCRGRDPNAVVAVILQELDRVAATGQ